MTLPDNPKPVIDAMIKPIAIDLSETETVLFDIIWIGATTKNKRIPGNQFFGTCVVMYSLYIKINN
jgi:hypothetical protein